MKKSKRNALIALRNGETAAPNSGEYWTEEAQEQLKQMYFDGAGFSEIALNFGRNEVAIYQQLLKSDLLSPQCKPRKRCPKIVNERCLCSECAMENCHSRREAYVDA